MQGFKRRLARYPNLYTGLRRVKRSIPLLDLLQNKVFDKFHGYHAPQWGQIWRKIGQAHSK